MFSHYADYIRDRSFAVPVPPNSVVNQELTEVKKVIVSLVMYGWTCVPLAVPQPSCKQG